MFCVLQGYYSMVRRSKIGHLVKFPLKGLRMGPYVISKGHENVEYDLFAVTRHFGGLGGGHYTAYAEALDGKWFEFDDNYVRRVPDDRVNDVVDESAYVLFYRRRREAGDSDKK